MSSNTDLCICAVNHYWNIRVTKLVLQQLVIRAQGTDLSQFFYNHATVWSCIKLGVLIFFIIFTNKTGGLTWPLCKTSGPMFSELGSFGFYIAGSP